MTWTAHLVERHGGVPKVARDERLVDFHRWVHSEFAVQLDHWHDEYGQLHEDRAERGAR